MPDGALYENSSATVWLRAGVVPPAARSAMAIVAAERVKVLAIACSPALTGRPWPAPRARVWARGPAAMCDGAQRTPDLSPRPLQCEGRSLLRPHRSCLALVELGRSTNSTAIRPVDRADAEPCLA